MAPLHYQLSSRNEGFLHSAHSQRWGLDQGALQLFQIGVQVQYLWSYRGTSVVTMNDFLWSDLNRRGYPSIADHQCTIWQDLWRRASGRGSVSRIGTTLRTVLMTSSPTRKRSRPSRTLETSEGSHLWCAMARVGHVSSVWIKLAAWKLHCVNDTPWFCSAASWVTGLMIPKQKSAL